jgi:hypothetical protein|tara:strand:+ start:144 stop:299 length:156 start_codon:yes stop_codon:yes gene_type:complete
MKSCFRQINAPVKFNATFNLIDNSFAELGYYQLTVRLFQAKWRSLLNIFHY